MDPDYDRQISDHVLRMHRWRAAGEQDGDGMLNSLLIGHYYHTFQNVLAILLKELSYFYECIGHYSKALPYFSECIGHFTQGTIILFRMYWPLF